MPYERETERQEQRAGGVLDWMAGRLHLSQRDHLPQNTVRLHTLLPFSLFFCKGGNSLQFPRCQWYYHVTVFPSSAGKLETGREGVEPGDRHLITLSYAANCPRLAGWSKAAEHSFIESDACSALHAQRQVLRSFPHVN